MQVYLLDWLNLLLRLAHVVTAIAWIGASFYFVFLDNSLRPPQDPEDARQGVTGELWAVHGGGFYHPQKYALAPPALPGHLHWFYWESYSTWLTGFGLFTALYLFNAGTYLVDKSVLDWTPAAAVAGALAFLAAGWLAYDAICRAFGRRRHGEWLVAGLLVAVVGGAAWGACQLFAGRAAFLLVGAMLATVMSANVLLRIIPGQRRVVAQIRAGQPVDPIHGWLGRQRSVHNTYFTLPVLVAMLSNHYGWLYQGRHNWAVLLLLMAASALVRHSFVARQRALRQGRRVSWLAAAIGVVLMLGVVAALAPRPADPALAMASAAAAAPGFSDVQAVVQARCVACHNAQVRNKNVALHTPALVRQQAQAIYQQAVVQQLMPMNNATGITVAERQLLRRWFEAGAP